MKLMKLLASLALILMAASCKTASVTPDANSTSNVAISLPIRNSKPVAPHSASFIPKAVAFRMSGDYADNVAVTLGANGNFTYFPAPTDISVASVPVQLADGWWLDRQGIGINSVFTKYTFAEYAALPNVPTVNELKASIIPGARVTETVTLPYNVGEAQNHIPEINDFLNKLK